MKINRHLLLLALLFWISFGLSSHTVQAAGVSAWMPTWGNGEGFESFQDNLDAIDVLSPFWYHVNEDGTLSPTEGAEDQEVLDFAQENGVPVIPTISNSFDGQKIHGFLNDEVARGENIQHIVDRVLEFDYDGIDIDYEGIWSEDTEAFTAYMQALNEALDEHDKKLTIAVMSQSYAMEPSFGTRGQDWEALGKVVDEFRIMTYDYGWRESVRPVAPHYWVEEVVEYAVDKVPREKIRLGIPFYGYAWSDNGVDPKEFYSYTYQSILGIVDTYGVDFQYDPVERTNKLFYVSQYDDRDPEHPFEIWFENHVSLEPKLELVEEYDLGGIAIWRLGREDEENWDLIRQMLKDEPAPEPDYFEDVTAETPYADSINRLAFYGLVTGQGETGFFEPNKKVNRAEILKMSLNSFAVDSSEYLFEEAPSDSQEVPSDSQEVPSDSPQGGGLNADLEDNVEENSTEGELTAGEDSEAEGVELAGSENLGDDDYVLFEANEESVLVDISGSQDSDQAENVDENSTESGTDLKPFVLELFPDVEFGDWFYAYVRTAVDEGVAEGYPDGFFRPGNNIIRVEALKLALESAGIDLSGYDDSKWYLPYQEWAIEQGLYLADEFERGEEITRAEAAYIIHRVIEYVEGLPQKSVFNT